MVMKTSDRLRVMLIDDSPVDARIVEKYLNDLSEWSVDFRYVEDENQGLQVLDREDFDVVLLDYVLIQTTGVEMTEKIRSNGHGMPIVMLTGHGDESVATDLIHAGGDDYLTKTDLQTETLEQSLKFVLEQQQRKQKWRERAIQWKQVAETDELTNLKSRRALIDALRQSVETAVDRGMDISFAMLDLDNFKQINDQLGHLVGDRILGKVGDIILDKLDPGDAAGRYGGDEIAVVFQNEDSSVIRSKCESIRDEIADLAMDSTEEEFSLNCSIGLAKFYGDQIDSVDQEDIYSLIDSADQALYLAKNRGTGQIERRVYSRDQITPVPVRLLWDDESARAWIIEHSRGGIRVSSSVELETSMNVVVQFDQPNSNEGQRTEFEGVVRWCRPMGDDEGYQIGVKTQIPRGIILSRTQSLK
ncbi:MAG: diguanylate cyclase [bacterium]